MSLARFENASGTTNTSNVRLEPNACCGVERQAAAIRIAASWSWSRRSTPAAA
jgi:hypothetical protein